ncbi:hypothetical protein AvCA_43130 [Azotobacter vinelandii CA]|uniref:Uncharacterized protein n=2 Tax=Azotobacter vinelandii TaxID=354 RepID=C1DFN8_AZOVD|nr:hypothetical protein Avin_43130 [Azotobacter vinelandii DJ]AGK15999.1 hypothetical protein AvCA_43130 [Azotobacter vinelandii CA]AGK21913.1 hypothetical protein AvCA6_43130 [Azotobacter vinelandii CA6]
MRRLPRLAKFAGGLLYDASSDVAG